MRSPSRKVAVEGKFVNSSPGVGAKRSRHIKADEKRETGLTKYNLQKHHIGLVIFPFVKMQIYDHAKTRTHNGGVVLSLYSIQKLRQRQGNYRYPKHI